MTPKRLSAANEDAIGKNADRRVRKTKPYQPPTLVKGATLQAVTSEPPSSGDPI